MRLLITAVMMVALAYSYTNTETNLRRVFDGQNIMSMVKGFAAETFLTLLWIYRLDKHQFHFVLFIVHFVLYVIPGGALYLLYIADLMSLSGRDLLGDIIFGGPIWLMGLAPIIIYGVGAIKQWELLESSTK